MTKINSVNGVKVNANSMYQALRQAADKEGGVNALDRLKEIIREVLKKIRMEHDYCGVYDTTLAKTILKEFIYISELPKEMGAMDVNEYNKAFKQGWNQYRSEVLKLQKEE